MSIKTVAVATTSVVVIAFAGATTYSSKVANRVLDEIAIESVGGQGMIKLEQLERENGLIRSSGVYSFGLDSSCIASDVSLPEVPAEIRYSVGHMPDATRLTSYTATVQLTGEAGNAFRAAAGQSALLVLEGELGFDGQWTHQARTPKIKIDQDGVQMIVSASKGEFTGTGTSGSRAAFAWSMPSIKVSHESNTIEFSGLSATGVIDDMQLGLGKQTIGIDRIDLAGDVPGGTALMSGVRFDYETVADKGRVSTSFTPSVNLVRAVGNTFQDLMFKVQLGGLDEQALREINRVTRHQCQTRMDDEQVARIERAILRIIDQGVSLSVTEFSGRQLENSFGGELILTLDDRGDGVDGPVKAMRERFSASGELSVSRNLVPTHLHDMLIEQGVLQANGEVMETTLSLQQGSLLVNGIDDSLGFADSVDMFLVMAEDGVTNWHEQTVAGNGPLVAMARAAREP